MSFFGLMEDEHLGSFWYRNHAIRGNAPDHKHLRRFMTNSARSWRLFPWAESEYENSVNLNNHSLLNMFRPTGIPHRGHWFGNGDQKRMGDFSNHFGDYRSISVRFCPICFVEQISDKGFVWFKRQWLIFNSAHCVVHKCSLQTFQCSNCGITPHIHAGIESFLIGQCVRCKHAAPSCKPKRVRKIPPLTLWLNYILERNFPHFSGGLINHLMYHSYWVLRKEQPERCGWVASHVYHLYRKHMRGQVASSLIWVPDDYNVMFYIEYLHRQFNWRNNVPLIMFWVAMMETFKTFEEFESFLESECILKTEKFEGKPDNEFLELKNPRSLYSIHRRNGYF